VTDIKSNHLERYLNPKIKILVIFWQFWAAAHISRINCVELAGDRPRQLAYENFVALNEDFNS